MSTANATQRPATAIRRPAAATKRAARSHLLIARAFVALVVVQFFLAGLGLFATTGFGPHELNAGLLSLLTVVLVALAVAGRLGRTLTATSVGLLVVVAVQGFLPLVRDDAPIVAALHPVNALVVLAVGLALARGSAVTLPGRSGDRITS